jgi:hypothetical protein
MAANKGYMLVEGHGEVDAAENLINRLSHAIGSPFRWAKPIRWSNLHQWENPRRGGVRNGADFIRGKSDAGALLLLKDEDDGCPKELAPEIAVRLRSLLLPFPAAYVLLRPEYEVLFLPCIERMGLPEGTAWDGSTWESRRGIKEWLSSKMPSGRSYKPTVDQLSMTQKIDLEVLRAANVPCFGSLERALQFLGDRIGIPGSVYPY